jgi:hypothetical protein
MNDETKPIKVIVTTKEEQQKEFETMAVGVLLLFFLCLLVAPAYERVFPDAFKKWKDEAQGVTTQDPKEIKSAKVALWIIRLGLWFIMILAWAFVVFAYRHY